MNSKKKNVTIEKKKEFNVINLLNMKYILVLLLPALLFCQQEYRYDSNKSNLPIWVKEMYKTNPNPAKVESLYKDYYNKNEFVKNKHTQYYKRWLRSISRKVTNSQPLIEQKKISGLPEWYCLGPFDFDKLASSSSYAAGAAHLYTVEQSLSNSDVLYAGAATSGLWKSTNKGVNWFPLFDKELLINEVYSIEIDHTNSDVIFFSNSGKLYKSTDGGLTYELLFELDFIKDIVMHPIDNNILFVCDESAFYKIDINENNLETILNGNFFEIEFHPNNPEIIYTVKESSNRTVFMKSTNGGQDFVVSADSPWPNPSSPDEQRRTEIAVSPDAPENVYALTTGAVNGGSGLYGIYVSQDMGDTWEFRCCGPQPGGEPSEENQNLMGWSHEGLDDGGQYYYDLALAVDPNNANRIHVGGVNHWISEDGGYTFNCPSKWSWADDPENQQYVHADIHDIKYYGDDLWIACDGGIFYSENQGTQIEQRMFGIAGTDFWGFGSGFSDGGVMIGGTYHNATLLKDNDTYIQGDSLKGTLETGGWASICGGDNYRGFVNFGDSKKVYLDDWCSGGGYELSNDRNIPLEGFSLQVVSNASYTIGESSNLEFDPRCYNIIYTGSGEILYKSFNNGYSSFPLYDFGENVTSIEVAWSNPEIIYVATYDGYWGDKNIWRTDNGGVTFVNITPTFPGIQEDNWIPYDITISDDDPLNVWIARCPNSTSYDSYESSKVYNSTNGGESWINMTGLGLNGENITNIEYHRGSDNGIYLGTRTGVYYKNSSMNSWLLYSNGLPMSTFSTQLMFDYQNNKLKNGTNRSVWEVDLYESVVPSAQISADKLTINCLNNTVYFVDHSAMIDENANWEWSFPGGNPSSSSEKNPIVTYDQEGSYDVILTIANSYGTDTQNLPGFITYSNDPIVMEGFDCDGSCQENFSSLTLLAEDSYGDGWNGNVLNVLIDGEPFTQYTLSSGYSEEINLCIPSSSYCVEVIVEEGGWPEEVTWELIDNEEVLLSGGSPFSIDLYGNCPIYGCTDSDAINFDPNADTDDGSCCLGDFYTVLMQDSYGDGWNGNSLIINGQELELEEGSEDEEVICLSSSIDCYNVICDGGDWQNEVEWTIYNSNGAVVLSGGAPFNDCFLDGCTDVEACNFNINATVDDGSCIYEGNPDCENISITDYTLFSNKLIKVSDVLGRDVSIDLENKILFLIYDDGTVKKHKRNIK